MAGLALGDLLRQLAELVSSLLSALAAWRDVIEVISSIAVVVSIVILVWDRIKDRPNLEIVHNRLAAERLGNITSYIASFKMINKGRREAPSAYASATIVSEDGLTVNADLRLQWFDPHSETEKKFYDFKPGDWSEAKLNCVYLSPTTGILALEVFAGNVSMRKLYSYVYEAPPVAKLELKEVSRLRWLLMRSKWRVRSMLRGKAGSQESQ